MTEQLKQLAMKALCNSYCAEFSALTSAYVDATKGLESFECEFESLLHEMTNVFGRDPTVRNPDVFLNIWTNNRIGDAGHDTMVSALTCPEAYEVHIGNKMVFVRQNGEWCLVNE